MVEIRHPEKNKFIVIIHAPDGIEQKKEFTSMLTMFEFLYREFNKQHGISGRIPILESKSNIDAAIAAWLTEF